MKKLWRILVVHSLADLFKHKSFFLLIFMLILADRGAKLLKAGYGAQIGLPAWKQIDPATAAAYVFDRLPGIVLALLGDYRFFIILIGLFLLKQLISLWPSSDMRRMHRRERGRFGILASLTTIRWSQVIWDAMAVSSLCLVTGGWCLAWFLANRFAWQHHPANGWLVALGVSMALIFPTILAGFSCSSKLAVISKGRFGEKLSLFFKLFTDRRVAGWSWLFYAARLMLEALFVVALPAYILATVDNFFARILLAALLATPVYSYLKMASFKFFLVVYEPFTLIAQEYGSYYHQLAGKDN